MGSYANRVVTLDFPELSSDPVNDPIRVVLRNPKLQPPRTLVPSQDVELVDGQPADQQAALNATFEVVAKLIIGWRVYDPTADITLDENLEPTGDQDLLPQRFDAETVAKLPSVILDRIGELVMEAINPR